MQYCRNCGEEYVTEQAAICTKCGVQRGEGNHYCYNCGEPTFEGAAACLKCGVGLNSGVRSDKSKLVAGLLGIFLGGFGIHNFYLGFTNKAILQLILMVVGIVLSCVFIGVFLVLGVQIWGFVEGILILVGKMDKDSKGNLLKE